MNNITTLNTFTPKWCTFFSFSIELCEQKVFQILKVTKVILLRNILSISFGQVNFRKWINRVISDENVCRIDLFLQREWSYSLASLSHHFPIEWDLSNDRLWLLQKLYLWSNKRLAYSYLSKIFHNWIWINW